MATVMSATTRSMAGRPSKRSAFVSRASILLRDAVRSYGQGELADALELAYQAALRTAGAYVAGSPIAKRRRLPSSVWEQLVLIGPEGGDWAGAFKDYSVRRSRLINGLDSDVSQDVVADLIELVEAFLDFVESGGHGGALAA